MAWHVMYNEYVGVNVSKDFVSDTKELSAFQNECIFSGINNSSMENVDHMKNLYVAFSWLRNPLTSRTVTHKKSKYSFKHTDYTFPDHFIGQATFYIMP